MVDELKVQYFRDTKKHLHGVQFINKSVKSFAIFHQFCLNSTTFLLNNVNAHNGLRGIYFLEKSFLFNNVPPPP